MQHYSAKKEELQRNASHFRCISIVNHLGPRPQRSSAMVTTLSQLFHCLFLALARSLRKKGFTCTLFFRSEKASVGSSNNRSSCPSNKPLENDSRGPPFTPKQSPVSATEKLSNITDQSVMYQPALDYLVKKYALTWFNLGWFMRKEPLKSG